MEKISETLQHLTMTNSLIKDDEYIKDGTIYCKKCNTPRETTIFFTGNPKKVRCTCKCQADEYKRLQEEQKAREKQLQIESLKVNSLISKRYINASFENCDLSNETFKKAWQRCKKYCEVADDILENGYGIYIFGPSGTGKTHLMACMCNELLMNMKQCLFTNFLEISKAIKATFNNKSETEERLIERISNIDYLFIDDLGTERLNNNGDTWLQEKVYDVINKRYNAKKPTVFTSNYTLNELITERGMMQKTVDRVLEMSNVLLKLEGKSYRSNRNNDLPF